MKPLNQKQAGVFLSVTFFFLQACGTPVAALTVTATPVPTQAPVLLSRQVILTSVSLREESQSPVYWITAQIPKFAGSEDPRALAFNEKANTLAQDEIQYFRENILAQMPITPVFGGSFFDAQYMLVFQDRGIWSLTFNFSGYADGAAHPYRYSVTFTFDLEQGKRLALKDLFLPDSDYLAAISRVCIAELSRRSIGFYGGFEKGAEPTAENYRNWNITSEGLMITFDEYQVAPYAAGAQTVMIPYGELGSIVNRQEALASFVP